jgi:hypothetical protein
MAATPVLVDKELPTREVDAFAGAAPGVGSRVGV